MSSTTAETTNSPNKKNNPEQASASEAPKKSQKRVAVTPPPVPSAVVTAYMVLRGAVLGVLGVDANASAVTVSLLQRTDLNEKRLCGKFGVHLGKKFGCGAVALPEDGAQQRALLQLLEDAANRIIMTESPKMEMCQMTKGEAVELCGIGILDASHKKLKDDEMVHLAWMDSAVVVCVPPGVPFKDTSCLDKITVEVKEGDPVMSSGMVCGKKARKAEITLKFSVTLKDQQRVADAELLLLEQAVVSTEARPSPELLQLLQTTEVRMPEGRDWLERVQQQEQSISQAMQSVTLKDDNDNDKDDKQKKKNEPTTTTTTTTTITTTTTTTTAAKEMEVNPFDVIGVVDYDRLVEKFGSKRITDDLMRRLRSRSRVPLHRFLRRDIFFSHRDLNVILDCLDAKNVPVYLYTGRGPSSASMHLGHLIPFLFTKWLQDALDCPLVIQMTDDEKFLFKGTYDENEGDNLTHFARLTMENARDIIACGFDFNKTFLFSDLDYVGTMYPNIVRIWKAVTTNTVNGIFGFDGTSNIGKVAFPAVQAAPSFASSFPKVLNADRNSDMACLIPCAIDQDPYFRMTRDVAHKLVPKHHKLGGKPALIHSKFFPALQGSEGKMSSSDPNSAIFLTDTPAEIERKIKKHAFSGGQENQALQRELGANLEVDVAYQWLRFFLEDDDELERIGKEYGSGQGEYWSTGKVKQKLIEVLLELVGQHQERRAKITDDEVRKWMQERCILGG